MMGRAHMNEDPEILMGLINTVLARFIAGIAAIRFSIAGTTRFLPWPSPNYELFEQSYLSGRLSQSLNCTAERFRFLAIASRPRTIAAPPRRWLMRRRSDSTSSTPPGRRPASPSQGKTTQSRAGLSRLGWVSV
jgi:hypothetical protein